jgi:hypothetical protein
VLGPSHAREKVGTKGASPLQDRAGLHGHVLILRRETDKVSETYATFVEWWKDDAMGRMKGRERSRRAGETGRGRPRLG